jgi:hypothetical protein
MDAEAGQRLGPKQETVPALRQELLRTGTTDGLLSDVHFVESATRLCCADGGLRLRIDRFRPAAFTSILCLP